MSPLDDRHRDLLRRTLSVIAWIHAVWSAALGAPLVALGHDALLAHARLLLAHAALLAAAGAGLWRPRRWGWPAAFLAAGGSLGFAIVDILGDRVDLAAVDILFALCTVGIFLKSAARLDRSPG